MKRRIISGVLLAAVVAAVLVAGYMWNSIVITAFISLLAAVGTYEFVANTAKIEGIVSKFLPAVFSAGLVFVLESWMSGIHGIGYNNEADYFAVFSAPVFAMALSVGFVLLMTVIILAKHDDFSFAKICACVGMPIVLSFAFAMLASVALMEGAAVLLVLLFICSCVCDMGAYFVGVTIGKHKLCPAISPNKTIEGAIGGIVSSLVIAAIALVCFDMVSHILIILPLVIVLCITGMLGDLFASSIKRSAGIKDFGNLIPGHGGVIDRLDSILFIVPVIYLLAVSGVI